MYTRKRDVRVVGISLLLFLIYSLQGWTQELTIKATDSSKPIEEGTDYTYDKGVLTIKTATPIAVTSNGQKTSDRIIVPAKTTATITLNNVNIESNYGGYDVPGGPLCMVDASVTLILEGENMLTSTRSYVPAISCYRSSESHSSSLRIKGPGSLEAIGSSDADGIGGYTFVGSRPPGEGDITIESGTLIAKSDYCRGIRGETVIVNGGVVECPLNGNKITVNSGEISNKISGLNEVTINDGKVTGTIHSKMLNIKGGLVIIISNAYCLYGENIVISGGIVILDGGKTDSGMNYCIRGTLSTSADHSTPGNAYIFARYQIEDNVIYDASKENEWSGVIFKGNEGKVYGNPTLPEGLMSIPSGATLTIEADKTLTIGNKSTLLVEEGSVAKSTIGPGKIVNNGTIVNNAGTIGLQGTFTNEGTYTDNGGNFYELGGTVDGKNSSQITTKEGITISFDGNTGNSEMVFNLPSMQVIAKNTGNPVKPSETPVRAGYTFKGWSESSNGNLISDGNWSSITSTTDKKLYALWKYNTKLAFNESSYSYTYGGTVPTVTATVNGAPSGVAPTGSISYSYYSDAECKNSISTPTAVGTYYVKATYPGDDNNMKVETSSAVTYTIEKKELTVNAGTITKVYDGETTVDLAALGLNGVVSGDESNVSLNKSDYSLTYVSKEVGTSINLTPTGTLSLSGDKSGNYTLVQPSGLTGAITAKELTITPTASQSVYKDEIPAYSVSGMVGLEKAAFSGALGVNAESPKKVTKGNLTLIDDNESGFKAANYTWELSSADVEITVLDKTMKDGIIEASSLTTDWSKKKVVLKAPTGFRIAAVSSLRSTLLDWKDQIEIEKEGNYDFECQLKRTAGTMPAQTVFIPIKLDNTDPVVSIAINHLIVTVTLSDDLSGLASCTYVWNNGGDKTETLITGNKTHSFTLTAPSAGSYPLKVVLTDQAGNETTYNGTVTLTNPTTPVDPPVGPSEPEETYTVTLPAVEGAATDPAAGNYEVTSWSDFGFLLTLDAAYSQSVPIVTTDRGETIEPRVSDGKYVIKRVRSNVSVSISGIVKNPDPVANEEVSSPALRIYTAEGILCLDVPTATEAWLITADGRLLRSLTLSPGLNRVYGLRQGVYIVRLKDGTTRKVLIG